jgi:L-iditol 2-dehydrogenase
MHPNFQENAMKAVMLTGLRQIELREIETPRIARDDEVLLKLEMVGVCGSDVHYYTTGRIGSQVVEYPFIVGHECSATVTQIGPAVNRVKVADKVAVDPAIVCQSCDQCLQGRENTCRNLKFLGCPGQMAGCLCEFIVMPQDSLFPLTENVTLTQAVLSEPLAIGVYAVRQAQIPPDAKIAVLGSGPIGLSVLLAAQAQDACDIYCTDLINDRLAWARNAGATWAGNPEHDDIVSAILKSAPAGMDVVFECAGQQQTLDQSIELLKPGGKLLLIGIPEVDRISFVIDKMRRKEITLINIRRQNHAVTTTLDLIASGKVNVDFMITHRFPLEQTQHAFEMVSQYRDGVVKAMIEF